MLEPVKKQSAEQTATDALRRAILSGHVAPGSRLVEAEVAQALCLSRGTVRAALQRLSVDGLVVPAASRGYEVASLSSHDVWELYTLRNAYESMAARLVASSIDAQKSARITEAFDALKRAVGTKDKAEIFDCDARLHAVIISLSGHRRLERAYQALSKQIRFFYILCNEFMSFDDYIVSHKDMVDAIIHGKAKKAAQLAADHNTADGQSVVEKLRALEAEAEAPVADGLIPFRPPSR